MDAPYQAAPDVHVLPTSLPLPGVGVLTVNAYVLLAEAPVDSFGAFLPEPTQDAAEVPAASGTSLERFLEVLESVPVMASHPDTEPAAAT